MRQEGYWRRAGFGMVLAALAGSAGPAEAHHSYAMFDMGKEVSLVGTIKEFQWTNPHSWIWLDVPGADGKVEQWGIEGMSPNYLARRGWTKETLKPGDKVTVVIHPLKNQEHGGSFLRVTLPDGTVMIQVGDKQVIGAGEKVPPLPGEAPPPAADKAQ